MTCIKTGCHIYIIPYGVYAYGDAHQIFNESFFFRLVEVSFTPLFSAIHFEINGYDSWWDREEPRTSTLCVASTDVLSYGYEGRETSLFPYAGR